MGLSIGDYWGPAGTYLRASEAHSVPLSGAIFSLLANNTGIPDMEEINRRSCAEDEPKFSLYKSMEFF